MTFVDESVKYTLVSVLPCLFLTFIFATLVARTDIDLIALDKGKTTTRKVVDMLMEKMEQYANFGFSFIAEKMEDDPNYFFKETAFLHLFLSFLPKDEEHDESELEELRLTHSSLLALHRRIGLHRFRHQA